MRDRVVIEFYSERDREDMLSELEAMGYVAASQRVKVCGMGMCGQAKMFSK